MTAGEAAARQEKQRIRKQVWAALERHRVVEPGVAGHIPAFAGADAAAARLAELPAFRAASTVKANPDRAQLPVRAMALTAGKTVYMAVPNLATIKPFYRLDPTALPMPPAEAAAHQAAATFAPSVSPSDMPPIDLVICGSVAVNPSGVRVGKGAGYSDIELALLAEEGLIGPHTTIVTTVHPLQVVDGDLPEAEHDFRVDFVVTPDEVIHCPPTARPSGLLWSNLSADKIASIPFLSPQAELDSRESL